MQAIKGSSGITNISDKALYDGVKHSIEQYGRPPIPTSIIQMIFGIIDTDSRIPGDDWRNDLYYAALLKMNPLINILMQGKIIALLN